MFNYSLKSFRWNFGRSLERWIVVYLDVFGTTTRKNLLGRRLAVTTPPASNRFPILRILRFCLDNYKQLTVS